MRTGRPIPPLTLSDHERETLERWARRPTTARALAERARLVLGCAGGKSNTLVARELRLTKQTIGKWRTRFLRDRLDGLLDEPRPGAPRRITDGDVERVMRLTLETAPRDATHWSTRAMARRCGLSQTAVSRIWRAFSLRPHRVKTFKLSKDPLFIEKVRDIVGLYLNPPDKALELCVDEKAQIQALDRTQPLLPMRPGQIERRTHDYTRHGTTSLFAALNVTTGKVIGEFHQRHRAREFRAFLDTIVLSLPSRMLGSRSRSYLLEMGPTILPELYPYLNDPEAEIRATLCDIIASFGDPGAIPRLTPLINDPSQTVADKANRAVERLRRVEGARTSR